MNVYKGVIKRCLICVVTYVAKYSLIHNADHMQSVYSGPTIVQQTTSQGCQLSFQSHKMNKNKLCSMQYCINPEPDTPGFMDIAVFITLMKIWIIPNSVPLTKRVSPHICL